MPFSSADPNAGVLIGMQSGQGSPQVTASKFRFVRYLQGTKYDIQPDTVAIREGGDGLDVGYVYRRKMVAKGQLVFNARPETIGPLLALIPGYASWNAASLPALHTFNTYLASEPWSTLVVQHPGSSIVHFLQDTRFTQLDIDGTPGEPLKITAMFTAITFGASSGVTVTPTNYAEDPFLYQGASYVLNASIPNIGGAASGITSFKISLKLGVDELYAQTIYPDNVVVMKRDIDVSLARRYENASLWAWVNLGGGVAPTQSVPTGDFTWYQTANAASGYVGANAGSLKIWAPLLAFRDETFTELDPDGKTVIETVQAIALKGATPALNLTLGNAHASAYAS